MLDIRTSILIDNLYYFIYYELTTYISLELLQTRTYWCKTPSKSRYFPSFLIVSYNIQWFFRYQICPDSVSMAKYYLKYLRFFSHQKYNLNTDSSGILFHKVLFTQYCCCSLGSSINCMKSCPFTTLSPISSFLNHLTTLRLQKRDSLSPYPTRFVTEPLRRMLWCSLSEHAIGTKEVLHDGPVIVR